MNCNIWKNCANRHSYLHLQKNNIKEKSQVFFPSFLCNALLIQEYDSIYMRCKYICLAPAVIPEPQRAKQHTPDTYFLDAQKEQDCNLVQNFCSLRVRESMPGCDLSHTGYIWNSFPEGCAPSDKWYNQEQGWDWDVVSFGKLCFCSRRGTLQKNQPGLSINCFSNLVILLDTVEEPAISVWCFLWVKCLLVCRPLSYFLHFLHSSVLSCGVCSHSFPLLWRLLSADSCYLSPASLMCWHLVVTSHRKGKRYFCISLWVSDFLTKCHLGNEWLGWFFLFFTWLMTLEKVFSSCVEDDSGHSNIDDREATLLPVLFFHLRSIIPVCTIYPKELFSGPWHR